MNIFETVKEMVSTREAASYYGIRVNRNGMACCPFHNDKTPSMKIDKRYYCFGCQETGDVIDFVGKLYGLNALESAKRIASDFGIAIPDYHVKTMEDISKPVIKSEEQRKRELQKVFENWVKKTTDLLLDYNLLLQEWELFYNVKAILDSDTGVTPAVPEGIPKYHPIFQKRKPKTFDFSSILSSHPQCGRWDLNEFVPQKTQ